MSEKEHASSEAHRSIEEIAADIAQEFNSERMEKLGEELDQALNEEDERKKVADVHRDGARQTQPMRLNR